MKKKILTMVLAGSLFSLAGCYTHMCPTYSVKPTKKPATEMVQQLENSLEKAS